MRELRVGAGAGWSVGVVGIGSGSGRVGVDRLWVGSLVEQVVQQTVESLVHREQRLYQPTTSREKPHPAAVWRRGCCRWEYLLAGRGGDEGGGILEHRHALRSSPTTVSSHKDSVWL